MATNSLYESTKSSEAAIAEESSIDDGYSAPEARFECPICLAWLRDPLLTSCGHRFCRNCITSWLERENACCPVDNMKLTKQDIFPDNFTRREISQQRTKCPNIVRGCLEELSPLDVESHLLVCEFRQPELPENEKLRCSFVEVGCDNKFEDEPELQRHLEQHIQKHLAMLSQAYTKLTLSSQENAGPSFMEQQANFWDPPSKNEEPQNASNDNINGLLKALYEKIVILEQKSREQDIIISNMAEQMSSMNLSMSKMLLRYANGCYLWYFNEFKNKINAMRNNHQLMHYSAGFYISPNGYRLCIRLNISPKDPNSLAILIHMMKSDHDSTLDWPFSGRLTITVVHPEQSYKSIKETMMTRPELDAFKRPVQDLNPKGFGYTEFVLIDELFSGGYVENNQLIIRVLAQPI